MDLGVVLTHGIAEVVVDMADHVEDGQERLEEGVHHRVLEASHGEDAHTGQRKRPTKAFVVKDEVWSVGTQRRRLSLSTLSCPCPFQGNSELKLLFSCASFVLR